jgi:hypothetical protein
LADEHTQQIANHESPRTLARLPAAGRATKLYDHTNDAGSLDEIERILIWREVVTWLVGRVRDPAAPRASRFVRGVLFGVS